MTPQEALEWMFETGLILAAEPELMEALEGRVKGTDARDPDIFSEQSGRRARETW